MLITQITGARYHSTLNASPVDFLPLEWYECNKRIMHKQTLSGRSIKMKFLQENPNLKDGDILYEDDMATIVVEILHCKAIVIKPLTIVEAASICYEIGNKHLPLFFENDELLVPYEAPLHRLLLASGYSMQVEDRKLNNPVKTSVLPHAHPGSGSLFNRILQLTNT